MEEINLRNYAYLGDAVWELFIREKTIHITNNSKKLHQITIPVGRRNIQAEYRQATAFETLIGWWFTHDKTRLQVIYELLEPKLEF